MFHIGFLIKLSITVLAFVLGTNWLLSSFVLDFMRDWTQVALNQQSNVSSVRKEKESAHYRNFLIPLGFPLTTGLSLSLGYKSRNGNVCDIWNAVMEVGEGQNTIQLYNENGQLEKFSLSRLNGLVKKILQLEGIEKCRRIGITVPINTIQGFVLTIAGMVRSVTHSAPIQMLSSVPRSKIDGLDIIVIPTWKSYTRLNGSENWYSKILILEKQPMIENMPANVIFWDDLVNGSLTDSKFDYTCPEDMSDDKKDLMYVTSPQNQTNRFSQMNLVSTVASCIKGFPVDHSLSEKDNLLVGAQQSKPLKSLSIWPKLFAVLLHGGSVSFLKVTDTNLNNLDGVTLASLSRQEIEVLHREILSNNTSIFDRIKKKWAETLFSEGIFTQFAKKKISSIKNMRCIYVVNELLNADIISSLDSSKIESYDTATVGNVLSSKLLGDIRSEFGCRVIQELVCPYMLMGIISGTNYYDYRVFPENVDKLLACFGTLETNLEAKMVEVISKKELDVTKRQGMLCIRGYSIGKPLDEERLNHALQLSDTVGGADGWMPLIGVFGLFGTDGCLYIYK